MINSANGYILRVIRFDCETGGAELTHPSWLSAWGLIPPQVHQLTRQQLARLLLA
jgi:hypothetical protein